MYERYFHFNFKSCVKWIKSGARYLIKTITGLFPLTWQDGIGGDLVDYSISGKNSANVWDEEWEVGGWSEDGKTSETDRIRGKNYIPCLPNTDYYRVIPDGSLIRTVFWDNSYNYISKTSFDESGRITTPENCYYMTFYTSGSYGTVYNHDISINYPSTDHDYHPHGVGDYGGKRNQLVDTATTSVTLASGHKYFTKISGTERIGTGDGSAVSVTGGVDNVIDLTLMFPSETITDVSTAKARIAEAMGGQQEYYPYDAGTDYYKIPVSVGRQNLFDEDTVLAEKGFIKSGEYWSRVGKPSGHLFDNNGASGQFSICVDGYRSGGTEQVIRVYYTDSYATSFQIGTTAEKYTFTTDGNRVLNYIDCDTSGEPTIYIKHIDIVKGSTVPSEHIPYYIQNKTIYRTTQLTANQTIRKTTDGLPNFTSLPTGYLQMGVDTEVQPSAGSVTYKSRSVSL